MPPINPHFRPGINSIQPAPTMSAEELLGRYIDVLPPRRVSQSAYADRMIDPRDPVQMEAARNAPSTSAGGGMGVPIPVRTVRERIADRVYNKLRAEMTGMDTPFTVQGSRSAYADRMIAPGEVVMIDPYQGGYDSSDRFINYGV